MPGSLTSKRRRKGPRRRRKRRRRRRRRRRGRRRRRRRQRWRRKRERPLGRASERLPRLRKGMIIMKSREMAARQSAGSWVWYEDASHWAGTISECLVFIMALLNYFVSFLLFSGLLHVQ